MNVSAAKENILKKIRKALTQSTPLPFPGSEGASSVFQPSQQELEIEFAEQFSKLLGKFMYCADREELASALKALIAQRKWEKIYVQDEGLKKALPPGFFNAPGADDLENADASITLCESLVARTGSIVLSSASKNGRTASVYAPVHICIAYTHQLVYDIKEALQGIKENYPGKLPSMISFATGPSRTADIEKTLVVGVHGPKEVYVFLLEPEGHAAP
ncbi:MAG: lactate utilization protein [Flavitalea sp.]